MRACDRCGEFFLAASDERLCLDCRSPLASTTSKTAPASSRQRRTALRPKRGPTRDRYGVKPDKLGSLVGSLLSIAVLTAIFAGLYYAAVNWPFTLVWVFLMVIVAFGALFGGLPTLLGDIWHAWFSGEVEGSDEES